MSRKSKAEKKAAKREANTVADSYDETFREISDHEAHRDVVYELPSYVRQVKECFMIQMKRYTKQKVMWFAAVLLVLIPILFFVFENVEFLRDLLPMTDVTNIYIASLLTLMPMVIPLLSAIACGSMLSQEFNERTVYLSLPLPMSRTAFFIGKFLAGLVLIEGVLIAAYGITMILAMTVTTETYTKQIFGSMVVMMFYVLFCCSLTYAMSTKLRRGSTMLPFILIALILPLISIGLAEFVSGDVPAFIASYLPSFSPEVAIYSLGNSVAPISVYGFLSMMFGVPLAAVPGKSLVIMIAASLLFSILFLYLGNRVNNRRDM